MRSLAHIARDPHFFAIDRYAASALTLLTEGPRQAFIAFIINVLVDPFKQIPTESRASERVAMFAQALVMKIAHTHSQNGQLATRLAGI
ncbi:hypothetical protein D3Y57_19205 [Sphingomonas paeninsulae]|uniref:Uncharacterized protein n=1 Tax=Sphingomonas paeninsulae TaxID=2319844 RepID=A0A494TKV9_SPHPE|nr:hypothetical protein [Sphingomonas paeninsulae]AYJ87663.1 hypothetical protein D3Y57_19205 [Sphingomonas paeninsulae]